MLTKIWVFTCYHSDDDRVRLSVKDFWAVSSLFDTFSYRKKQFCFIAHNKLNPFFIILNSIVRLLNVQFTLIVRFLWHCNNKNTRHRVKPLLKKGGKAKKEEFSVRDSFAEKKRTGEWRKKKRSREKTKTARLVKFDFRVHGACQILVSISEKQVSSLKTNVFMVFL